MISITVNGANYSFFTSVTATKQMDSASGSFQFNAVSTKKIDFPVKVDDKCEVFADDVKIIDGFVEGNSGSFDARSHRITISGRDKTADFIDSTIYKLNLKAPISLKRIIEEVISQIGAQIKVIDNARTPRFESAQDIISSEIGENAFEYVMKLARKKQVLITSNGDGDIVIEKPATTDSGANIIHKVISDDNNIVNGSWDYNNTSRFSRYKAVSQMNMVASSVAGSISPKDLTNQQSDFVVDPEIRSSRQLIFQAENLSSKSASVDRTTWEANIRQTRGRVYSCIVPSFFINGVFLKPNILCNIFDEHAEISDLMLLNSVQYAFDSDGNQSLLGFVNKNSYQVALEEPQDVGQNFFA